MKKIAIHADVKAQELERQKREHEEAKRSIYPRMASTLHTFDMFVCVLGNMFGYMSSRFYLHFGHMKEKRKKKTYL